MPEYLRTNGYKVYFWSNEDDEPVHFHLTKGNPSKNDTKIWILSNMSFEICHNKGRIPSKDLTKVFSVMQSYIFDFLDLWKACFSGSVKFYR